MTAPLHVRSLLLSIIPMNAEGYKDVTLPGWGLLSTYRRDLSVGAVNSPISAMMQFCMKDIRGCF
jgi:hypothetical protein